MKDLDFELFFKQHEARIHYQIHRLGISHNWYDDFYAEGILALWDAYKEFDEAKGNLGTFVNYKIRFRLIDLLRKKYDAKKRWKKQWNKPAPNNKPETTTAEPEDLLSTLQASR